MMHTLYMSPSFTLYSDSCLPEICFHTFVRKLKPPPISGNPAGNVPSSWHLMKQSNSGLMPDAFTPLLNDVFPLMSCFKQNMFPLRLYIYIYLIYPPPRMPVTNEGVGWDSRS